MCLPAGSPVLSGSSPDRRAVTRAATDGQHWLNRTGLAVGFAHITYCCLMGFFWSLLVLTARKRNSKETALALEKLLPKRCQVLGLVTPGIVGKSKIHRF